MSQFSQPIFSFAGLTPALSNVFIPEFREQERGDTSGAYCDPEFYQVPIINTEYSEYVTSRLLVVVHSSSRYSAHTGLSLLGHRQNALQVTSTVSDTIRATGAPHVKNLTLDVMDATIQEEQDIQRIDQWINTSSWLKLNVYEPLVGSPDSSPLVDKYGVRGLSCYSSLVEGRDDGTFGCRQERCMHFSAKTMEGAIKHQRAHYDHRPYKCDEFTGLQCDSRFFSAAGTTAHIHKCHST